MSDEVDDQKRVEFYSAGLTAWYNTRLEHDKSLLTLSAGGIGLLMTLMTTVGVSSAESLVLYICALVAFSVLIGISAAIHSYSKEEKKMASPENPQNGQQPLNESLNGVGRLQLKQI